MSRENHFVYNPSTIDIGRSKFDMPSFWKGDIYHGDLVPLEITRVMPSDDAIYDIDLFIRTATPPIAPFFCPIRLNVAAFYVPERLVWSKEKEFYGENVEGYGIQSEVLAPRTTYGGRPNKTTAATTYKRSIGTYLGIVSQNTSISDYSPISLNPIRCFFQVYNDWFRNENFMSPYLWDHSQTGDGSRYLGSRGGSNINLNDDLPHVCKQLDRFTSCLPWAQKGDPVLIGAMGLAPVITGDINYDLVSAKKNTTYDQVYGLATKTGITPMFMGLDGLTDSTQTAKAQLLDVEWNSVHPGKAMAGVGSAGGDDVAVSSIKGAIPANLYADLSKATATTINEFRLAFATQRYLETLARTGSKYREVIKGLFGCNIGDTTAQMAEYLGGMTLELNVDQVLQTTGYAAGGTTTLAAPGAVSCSACSGHLFTKGFSEPGFIVIVAYTKHNRSYGQGIDEIYQKHEILEEYNPKFANIGEQAIKTNSIYFDGSDVKDDDRFGFQEAWSEYRYKRDMVVGSMAPSNSSSYNFWTLAENFASAPALNADFLTEDRTNVARALSGGTSSPDYFLDVKFRRTFVRPMPLYSIPGLIDHH